MNILKASELIDKNTYQKMFYHFDMDRIWNSIISGIKGYRHFNIMNDGKNITLIPKNDYFSLDSISYISKLLDIDENFILTSSLSEKIYKTTDKKKILTHLHIDWILALEKIKENDEHKDKLIEYLKMETFDLNLDKKINRVSNNKQERSNIYTLNRDSVIIDMLNQNNSRNLNKLSLKNRKLLQQNKLISFFEIDKGFDNNKLSEFILLMNEQCNDIVTQHSITNDMKFTLKIRKIKRTQKKGMYIKNQNTIILDPRHVDSFTHELGHWYHCFFHPEIDTEEKAEIFADNFMIKTF